MPKPSAPEDICNLALDLLKQAPIVSIKSPTTATEYIMQRWYDIERQSALRSHPWKFATKRALLSPNPTAVPPFGYQYAYDLPSDYIRMVSVGDDYLGDVRMSRVIENGQILTPAGSNSAFPTSSGATPADNTTLFIRYIYDIVAVGSFDSLFIKYLAMSLAMQLSTKFAISAALARNLQAQYEDVQTQARTVNGQDAPIKRVQSSRLLTKRRGLPGGIYANRYTIFDS